MSYVDITLALKRYTNNF